MALYFLRCRPLRRRARKGMIHNEKLPVPLRWLFILCMVLLSVYAQFTGDYVGYKDIVNSIFSQIRFIPHFEDVYVWIIHAVTGDYEMFRLVIALLTYIPIYTLSSPRQGYSTRELSSSSAWDLWNALEGRQQIAIYLAMLGLIMLLLEAEKDSCSRSDSRVVLLPQEFNYVPSDALGPGVQSQPAQCVYRPRLPPGGRIV